MSQNPSVASLSGLDEELDQAAATLAKIELENAAARSVAGALTSDPKGLDHRVESLTVSFSAQILSNSDDFPSFRSLSTVVKSLSTRNSS